MLQKVAQFYTLHSTNTHDMSLVDVLTCVNVNLSLIHPQSALGSTSLLDRSQCI